MIPSFLLTCILSSLLMIHTSIAVPTTQHGKRGVARMMTFNLTNTDNSQSSMEKRDRVTWYNGPDLKNAACYGLNGLEPFHAATSDMIGAMAMHDLEQCYKCMQITNNRQKNMKIVVAIVDKCAACRIGTHIDLTPAAFQKLSPGKDLNVGTLDISYKPVKCPRHGGLIPNLPKLLF